MAMGNPTRNTIITPFGAISKWRFRRHVFTDTIKTAFSTLLSRKDRYNFPRDPPEAISDRTVVARNRELPFTELHGQAVILSLEKGAYFELNGTGSAVWRALAEPAEIGTVCKTVADAYQIDVLQATADIKPFIAKLMQDCIILRADARADKSGREAEVR
jgi:hypothetical protein